MAEEIKFSEFTAADPATLEAAGGIVPSAVAGIGNNKSTWTQIKNWISNPLLALINNMVDKTKPMLQIMIGGLRSVYFSARWFEMDIEDSQPTSVKGAMWYGSDDNLPVVNLDYGVTGSLLDDVITPALNKTGSVIPNGTVCYVSGSQGNRTVVSLAQAVLTPATQIAIVVATHNVANNALGYFVNRGLVNQLNTSAYTEGQILWVSTTAGQLTGTAPAKPYSQIAVGVVTRVHATVGQIRVFPFPIPRLGQLTDVNTTGIASGQSLRLNSSGVFEPYTPLELGETSSTAYRGDRGKAAYDHSQVMGNPHGTDFSELENKPTTLAGYGITDATVKRSVTVSSSAGWYRLGYVDLKVNTYNYVFGEVYYSSASFTGLFSFSVTRNSTPNNLAISTFYSISCQNPPSVQWEVLGNGDIRVSWYAYFNAHHLAFAMYNIKTQASLDNAYTHEYIGATKPANTELVNCLDRVTLTDESASSTLPIGDMPQPTAIQVLRNNVKQLQSTARQNGRVTSQDWNSFTEPGVYNVANWSGANGPTINGVQAYKWGFLVVEAFQNTVIQTFYPHQSGMPYYRQSWEGGAFVGWSTSPTDRVTLTDEPAQDVLPSGSMTQPTAIQWLRNNVKQIFTALTNKLDRVIDSGRLLISYAGGVRVTVGSSNFDFDINGLRGVSPAKNSNTDRYATTEWVRQKLVPSSIGANITSNATITPVDGELRVIQNPSSILTVTITNTPTIGTISYIGVKFSAGCAVNTFQLNYTDLTGASASETLRNVNSSTSYFGLYVVRLIKGNTGWMIDR